MRPESGERKKNEVNLQCQQCKLPVTSHDYKMLVRQILALISRF